MFSTILVAATLALAANPTDAPRKAYAQCIEQFVKKGLDQKLSAADFEKALAPACAKEEAKLRETAIAYDMQDGVSRADAEKYIGEEINDLQSNMRTMYQEYLDTGTRPG